MMGTKARIFAPIAVISLEDLVPINHFYRHLDHVLDLSFVRDLVKETYAHGGRPSIDPVVFFKLQLVLFFEDIRSERLLMQLVADKLSVRWYVGYNLHEPLPDHSSLTRIRERYGVEVFRRFFEAIVEQCQAAGLVWGKELYFEHRSLSPPRSPRRNRKHSPSTMKSVMIGSSNWERKIGVSRVAAINAWPICV